jgi:anaerobic selenocysteine-containing dehydrogenase
MKFGAALADFFKTDPGAKSKVPFILSKTLGKTLGSGNLASLWGLFQNLPKASHDNAQRLGFIPGPGLGEALFQAVLEHPEGLFVGESDTASDNLEALATEDGRINLDVPEMAGWLKEIDPVAEAKLLDSNRDFPLILSAGRHMDMNANTLMRNPIWNQERRACTATMHPEDAEKFGFSDGMTVRVVTEAGDETIDLQVTDTAKPGHIAIPQGFGLVYQGKAYGANVNRLTKNTHRDRLAGTPLHRYVPCRVEAV